MVFISGVWQPCLYAHIIERFGSIPGIVSCQNEGAEKQCLVFRDLVSGCALVGAATIGPTFSSQSWTRPWIEIGPWGYLTYLWDWFWLWSTNNRNAIFLLGSLFTKIASIKGHVPMLWCLACWLAFYCQIFVGSFFSAFASVWSASTNIYYSWETCRFPNAFLN